MREAAAQKLPAEEALTPRVGRTCSSSSRVAPAQVSATARVPFPLPPSLLPRHQVGRTSQPAAAHASPSLPPSCQLSSRDAPEVPATARVLFPAGLRRPGAPRCASRPRSRAAAGTHLSRSAASSWESTGRLVVSFRVKIKSNQIK